ncbi:MAG: double-strand break repair protein AddB [Alphaproteobacteria bacterium]
MSGPATSRDLKPPAGSVYTIPAGTAFLDALAAGILDRHGSDPAALAAVQVLLPTRRACRALGEAFLRATDGAPVLLPAMTPIGDIDEDELGFLAAEEPAVAAALDLPPAIPALRRQLLLSRLIMAGNERISVAHAARLAQELARLLDEAQTERLDFTGLDRIVPDRYAGHWQETLEFLKIVTENWPAILQEQGCIDPADRRNRLIEAQIALWQADPPAGPVIAAGSTGSIPATADLLSCVAALPLGAVVLPGLDLSLDEDSRAALGPGHPQFGMNNLLRRMDVDPADVTAWTETGGDARRVTMLNAALRPPATAAAIDLPDDLEPAFSNIRVVTAPGPQQEALSIALIMRDVLEDPARTAALITPDRRLARRVAAELRRWNIDIDDSGGTPLSDTVPGVFLRLTAAAVVTDAAPVPLLAALKHPLAAGGIDPARFRDRVREMETAILRGPRPAAGFAGLHSRLSHIEPEAGLTLWAADLASMAAPLTALINRRRASVVDLLQAHIAFAEALAASSDETGVERLWAGEAGESAASLINDLRAAAEALPPIPGRDWPALLDALMAGAVVRPRYGRHPRLSIWGLLEARLQQADLVVLGGLNEGVWPPEPATDPWMSRPMRDAFGLAPPERRIGLTAHDFIQAIAAPDAVVTRSTRIDGSPTVPARWLTRIETLLSASETGRAVLRRWADEERKWLAWQTDLDTRLDALPTRAPAPVPPLDARPDRLSVTDVETLVRDPYAIYAKRILELSALDPLDADPGAADRGSIIHNAIDRFVREAGDEMGDDARGRLLAIGEEEFAPWLDRPGIRAFWWPRFERIADWVVALEADRAPGIVRRHTEVDGLLTIERKDRPFRLRARADRIDQLAGGGYEIIDYKTGAVPPKKDVNAGLSPQLPLEAAMIVNGAFGDIPPGDVTALTYWKLSGGDPAGEIREAGDDPMLLADAALAGLIALLDHYDNPETPYIARPDPDIAPRHSDFEHLERVQEWSSAND